jgi:hypothetical protein
MNQSSTFMFWSTVCSTPSVLCQSLASGCVAGAHRVGVAALDRADEALGEVEVVLRGHGLLA